MMKIHTWIILVSFVGIACNNPNLKKAPFITASTFVEESTSSSGNAEAKQEEVVPEPIPMPPETKTAEEKVSPPANISGSYLICAEMQAATEALPEAVVNCGLRDKKTNNKIDISAGYVNSIWSYQADLGNTMVVSMIELPKSLEWHISITLRAPSLAEVQEQQAAIRFYVSVMNNAGIKYQESTVISPAFVRWMTSNGAPIPATAAIGGTENDGANVLYLCRMYVGTELIPGRLHTHDNNISACHTVQNGSSLASHQNDGTMTYRTDVLAVTQGVFDDYFEWIPATSGLKPAQAIITGYDSVGNPHYTCRNLQNDNNIAEQTPGVLRPGASSCAHEFNGAKSNINYQVLSWKEAGTKKIMDTRQTPAP
ncbi:MAG: DUF3421 domain-containing protein [Pseudobdellovibrionaceae bacterium]|nr:DUF3421 domain-containing protein [Pseudobdellovibrionaceae bacterium]